MTTSPIADIWASGDDYERYVGRWSRQVAPRFLAWIDVPGNSRWLDVGSGTGALATTILRTADPLSVEGIDASVDYVAHATAHVPDDRVRFQVGDARTLPFADGAFDAAVSGLALNFVPEPALAVADMVRVTRPNGVVAAYVWDYLGRMEMMRYFWDAAKSVDAEAQSLDERTRFAAICQPDILSRIFAEAGLQEVETHELDIPTVFTNFDDYWNPFLGGQGSAPSYLASRPTEIRDAIREQLRARLPTAADGSISLIARALAVRGHVTAH